MTPGSAAFMAGVPELLILKLLSRREMYGYELAKAVEATSADALSLFQVLRARLLDGGVSPRRVRRLLQELRAHCADLRAEGERAGLDGAAALQRAVRRLGTEAALAEHFLARREYLSWSRRWPWAVFGIAPPASSSPCCDRCDFSCSMECPLASPLAWLSSRCDGALRWDGLSRPWRLRR
jgi:hypothetical protein